LAVVVVVDFTAGSAAVVDFVALRLAGSAAVGSARLR
jgi:hypothetical protein